MFQVSDLGHRDVETPSSNNGQDNIGMIDLVILIKLRKTATLKLRENCFFLIQVRWTRNILTQDKKQAFHQIMVITRTTTVSLSLVFVSSGEIYFNLKIKAYILWYRASKKEKLSRNWKRFFIKAFLYCCRCHHSFESTHIYTGGAFSLLSLANWVVASIGRHILKFLLVMKLDRVFCSLVLQKTQTFYVQKWYANLSRVISVF